MPLKPQDLIVALKLVNLDGEKPSYNRLAHELALSPSEAHAAVRRAIQGGLLDAQRRPNRRVLLDFILHGVRTAFFPEHGSVTRGMPTAYAAPPLSEEIMGDDLPPVWPDPEGMVRGETLKPLYRTVPTAARNDPQLYELLALVDAIRIGRARAKSGREVPQGATGKMTVESPAIEWVRIVAERLGDLRDEVVFLGGATVGLLITDPATSTVRGTKDVDVIVEVGSWGEYVPLQERLREKGFSEDTSEDAPLCRWVVAGITVDVMPTTEQILGFSNHWYSPAMKTAERVQLTDTLTIRIASPPYFMATKIEAFHGRGGGDYMISHDIEDLVAVVDGRPEINSEIEEAADDLRTYLHDQLADLLADDDFR